MEALIELMAACEKREMQACRRWQKEVCQLRGPLLDRHGYIEPPSNGLTDEDGEAGGPGRPRAPAPWSWGHTALARALRSVVMSTSY